MSLESHLAELVEQAVSRALAAWSPPAPASNCNATGPRLLKVEEAAEILSISSASVRRLLDSGKLPAVRCFTSLRIDQRDIMEFIDRVKKGAK